MNKSKVSLVFNQFISTIQIIFGVIILLFGLIGFSTGSDSATVGVATFFCAIGILLLFLGIMCKKLISLFRKYIYVLSNDPTGSISNLAEATKASESAVIKNLQKMISKKFFVNAYIDYNLNSVIMYNHVQQNNSSNNEATQRPNVEEVIVTCKGCGGINHVAKNSIGECEYCGSKISG